MAIVTAVPRIPAPTECYGCREESELVGVIPLRLLVCVALASGDLLKVEHLWSAAVTGNQSTNAITSGDRVWLVFHDARTHTSAIASTPTLTPSTREPTTVAFSK
jgi:hypothetical protein